ncbi:MAG: protease modulator HflC [Succinivibrionaceae bacterium]
MNFSKIVIVIVVFIVVAAYQSLFIVKEGERVLITRFDKVLRDSDGNLKIYEPGPYFKIPFIDKVKTLDARIQTLNSTADRFVTSEKKDLIIDSYVKWKIVNFAKFYTSTKGDKYQAEELLRNKITNSLRSQIGLLTIKEIVSGYNSENNDKKADTEDEVSTSKRDQVMQNAQASTSKSAISDLGIEIIDVRMMQINLPKEVSNSIYQRMRAERSAVARLHRSQGSQEAEAIRANADRQAAIIIADAERNAKMIRGDGDAKATQIYASSYSKNPKLFDFLRSMDAYTNSMTDGKNIIVTDTNNNFLEQFK